MLQVYLRDKPRSIYLIADSENIQQGNNSALLLTTQSIASASTSASSSHRAVVETIQKRDIPPLSSLQKLQSRAYGCLGLINVGSGKSLHQVGKKGTMLTAFLSIDLFVALVTSASSVGSIRPNEAVMRISTVSFYCLNKAIWDDTLAQEDTPQNGGPLDPQGPAAQPYTAGYTPAAQTSIYEHPCASLRKLLGTGSFYFALEGRFDLSRRLEKRVKAKTPLRRKPPPTPLAVASSLKAESEPIRSKNLQEDLWNYDERFVWNSYMMDPLLEFRNRLEVEERAILDRENFFILAIQGFIGIFETLLSGSSIALVSRLSWKRAGTRFNTRGIDDDGNVANFAESETLFCYNGLSMSYCQVRGSVPMFWEQQGLQAFNARIQITRPRVASQPAFDRHFSDLLEHYSAVHAVNLLGTRDAETILSSAYADHMRHSNAEELYLSARSKLDEETTNEGNFDRMGLTNLDFHTISRSSGGLDGVKSELKRLSAIQAKRKAFKYTLHDGQKGFIIEAQRGVFRINCLDCLDRTNVVEDIISQNALELLMESRDDFALFRDVNNPLWVNHRVLWAENGDALSKIYAGTGALNTAYTRSGGGKKTLGGLLSDAAKSASRMYINNFQDKSKQNVIDALLGNMANQKPVSVWDPLHDAVNLELSDRMDEYSTKRQVHVYTGTWNLAGQSPSGESLEPFLFPRGLEAADIYALGLQEVVPLTAQQILMTDPDKLRAWEVQITDTFSRRNNAGEKERYILLRSEQLVGTALMILIKESLLPHVRQVEASTKKTGLKGMSGNKGGVSIRLIIHDTSFCFLTAHFAAGKTNVEERNADFMTISRELHFNRGRSVQNSNYCFWFGDFNYRLEGGNEVIRPMCESREIDGLIKRDQLVRSRASNQVFSDYKEAPLTFLPTYKYDYMSQVYDTSEKLRVPAWTDRVLYRNQYPFEVEVLRYDRAELLTSDHRPVFAAFTVEARVFDSTRRNALRLELLAKHKSEQLTATGALIGLDDLSDSCSDEDEDIDYNVIGLPEPSTETANWWDGSNDDEASLSDNYDDLDVATGNPFLHLAQYAIKPFGMDSPNLSSGASSARDHSPLPSIRRTAPRPPTVKKPVINPDAAYTTQSPRPPPVPRKPVPGLHSGNSSPKLPPRPGMGSRTQSHASIRSGVSLLDDNIDGT